MSFEADAQHFPKMRRDRGMQLAARHAARVDSRDGSHVLGTVEDRKVYTVHLSRDGKGRLVCDCSCMGTSYCEHAFALLIAADLPKAAPKQKPKPPPQPPAPAAKPIAAPVPAPLPKAPDWRDRLDRILAKIPEPEAAPTAASALHFVMDVERARRHARLRLFARRPPTTGGDVTTAATAPAAAAERRVLALLAHVHREDSRTEGTSHAPSDDEAELLIPHLLATGRFFATNLPGQAKDARVPLRSDTGPPASFHSELRRADGKVALHGWLERHDERLPPERVHAVLGAGYALIDDALVGFPAHPAMPLVRALLCDGPLVAPSAEEGQLVTALLSLAQHFPALAPPIDTRKAPPPTGVLVLQPAKATRDYVPAELQFDYGERRVDFHAAPVLQPPEPDGVYLRTDPAAETAILEQCQTLAGAALAATPMPGCFTIARRAVGIVMGALVAGGFRVLADGKPLRSANTCSVRVETGIDWFSIRGTLDFADGVQLPLGPALDAMKRGERFVEIGNGQLAMLPEDWLRRWGAALQLGERDGDGFRMRTSQAMLLDAMLATRDGTQTEWDGAFAALRQRLAKADHLAERAEPPGFQGSLRPYQRRGLGWLHFLHELRLGGCLADDMGLGKTVQVLALLVAVHAAKPGRPSLLVVPLSLLDNWRREAARFTPSLRVFDFHGSDRWQRLAAAGDFAAFDLVLTTYGTLRQDIARHEQDQRRFTYAVLDEAQAIENDQSQTSKAVRLLRADHRLAMTGTPVQNHLGELWALFEFLTPGLLGRSSAWKKLLGETAARSEGSSKGLDLQLLHRALAPVLLRRTKQQVLPDLPAKQEQDLVCELDGSQEATYATLRDHYRDRLLRGDQQLGNQERFMALEALLRLRQAACHEGLLDPAKAALGSAKLDALLPMLREIADSGHKALVFSQFTEFLAIVRARLEAAGLTYEYLDGKTRKRQERVDRFQQDAACPFFLISLKAGGVGLNLTAADYVFLLDPWWNPATENQAVDRAHRIGRADKVTVYRLVARGTVEEKVLQLQAEKRQLVDAVLGGAEQSLLAKLTRDDLAALLS